MSLEQQPHSPKVSEAFSGALPITQAYANLDPKNERQKEQTFEAADRILTDAGFSIVANSEAGTLLSEASNYSRSESFNRVMSLVLFAEPITIENPTHAANACKSTSKTIGDGYRTAMLERFSGNDVKNRIKVVVTFEPNHLDSYDKLPSDHELWQQKPNTAAVSVAAEGSIALEDVRLISMRFGTSFLPEAVAEAVVDDIENTPFVILHYKRIDKKEATH